MSTQVQYRRGTAAQNDAFTGALAEITVDTTNWSLRVHDGVTAGGTATVSANSSAQLQAGNILPQANSTYNLGSATKMWKSLYVSGNTIYLGNLQLKEASANTFAVFTSDGITQANVDVGFLMNRANGLLPNTAFYWSESLQSFVTALTANTGVTRTNIAVQSYANVTTGNGVTVNFVV